MPESIRSAVLPAATALLAALAFGCGEKTTDHAVTGKVEYRDNNCRIDEPSQFVVSVDLVKGNRRFGASTTVDVGGSYSLTIPFPQALGEPEGAILAGITNVDGTPICRRPTQCGPGTLCMDFGTVPRLMPVGEAIDVSVICSCTR